MNTFDSTENWSLAKRIAFRFVFVYLALYNVPDAVGLLPKTQKLGEWMNKLGQTLIPWIAKHWLHLKTDITIFPNGSGDTTYNYVQILVFAAIAVMATLLWSLLDRHRPNYAKLHEGLRILTRYVLGFTMLSYGLAKVFKSQFPFPSHDVLVQAYGESSPMRLLWNFMGYSTAYTVFAGLSEVVGGLLLFWRRTTTLGALVVSGVMLNVVMMNFSYDVPVKLYSSHLLLMAIFLLLPEFHRLMDVFIFNRTAEAILLTPPMTIRWMRFGRWGLKAIFLGFMIITMTMDGYQSWKRYGDKATKPALCGIYEVERFNRNGEDLPPLLTDAIRWRRVVINTVGAFSVYHMPKESSTLRVRYRMEDDAAQHRLRLLQGPQDKPTADFSFHYQRPDPEHMNLEGVYGKDTLKVELKRVDESQFLLVNRGFHWINETPFNR
jgi:uncharacterized membrane protein YphA (DoxX/SURF4 family)